jgi:hypothetical protein
METSYSFDILTNGSNVPDFNGVLTVSSGVITAVYDTSLPDYMNTNLLIPTTSQQAMGSDNVYPITSNGFSISSTTIAKIIFNNINGNNGDINFNISNISTTSIVEIVILQNNITYSLDYNGNPYLSSVSEITDVSCFNEGTKILCLNKDLEEEYIPIENLRKGNLVKTYKHGYRKIDLIGKNVMVNNPNVFNQCMYKMKKNLDNGLLEELIVTGGHSILVDELGEHENKNDELFGGKIQIDDKYLLLAGVSDEFTKLENNHVYTYYHFVLENNGDDNERFGVWANGVLTETPSKNVFTNHKYILL